MFVPTTSLCALALSVVIGQVTGAPVPLWSSQILRKDFPINIAMVAAAAELAAEVPVDGTPHAMAEITCLDILASSEGNCAITSVTQIGISQAGLECYVEGVDGFAGWIAQGSFTAVNPPQQLATIACQAAS